jgi:DNA replication protein DnaC
LKDSEKVNELVKIQEKFIDLTKNNTGNIVIDIDAKNHLVDLKKNKIPKYRNAEENTYKYEVEWEENGIKIDNLKHREEIEKFGQIFYERVKNLIDKNYKKRNNFLENFNKDLTKKNLIEEVLRHQKFCNKKVEQSLPNDNIKMAEQEIKEYINRPTSSYTNTPLIVYGASGCGKTSILAKISNEVIYNSKNIYSK